MKIRCLLLPVVAGLAAACASGAGGEQSRTTPRQANQITPEEIHSRNYTTTLELVQALRPSWLRTRGEQSILNPGDIMVYVNGVRFGGVESLRQIPTIGVTGLQFIDASTATTRWGTGHAHGAILVRTNPHLTRSASRVG